jgi:uncharacterized protein
MLSFSRHRQALFIGFPDCRQQPERLFSSRLPGGKTALFSFDKTLTATICVLKTSARSRLQMEYFLCVIGMVMIIEGLPYFGFPDRMKAMMRFVLELSDDSLRKIGFGLMLAGLVLVYIGKS